MKRVDLYFAIIAVSSLTLSSAPCSACTHPIETARSYLAEQYHFERENEKILALSETGLREPEWSALKEFFPTEQFYYFHTSFPSRKYALIVVFSDCRTVVLDGIVAVENMLELAPPQLRNPDQAAEYAQLLLRMLNVSGVYGQGYKDGVNMIRRTEDITFSDSEERAQLEETLNILEPSLHLKDGGFSYTFNSWNRKGNGNVYRTTLTYTPPAKLSLDRKLVAPGVGAWEPAR